MPWEWIASRLPERSEAHGGVARDHVALARLERARADRPRVAVLGSSRAEAGFEPDLDRDAFSGVALAKLAHPGMMPFEIRALIGERLESDVDVAVIVLSEIETHHPIWLRAFLSWGNASALIELVRAGGIGFVRDRATDLYRLAFATLSSFYRDRDLLRRAGLDAGWAFPIPARLRRAPDPEDALTGRYEPVNPLSEADRTGLERAVRANLTDRGALLAALELAQLRSLARGAHVRIQLDLLRSGVARLRAAGVEVILVEPPVFPPAQVLYDPALRDDFVEFATSLAADLGVRFVRREAQPAFGPRDFLDFTHLNRVGAGKLTRVIAEAVRASLSPSYRLRQ